MRSGSRWHSVLSLLSRAEAASGTYANVYNRSVAACIKCNRGITTTCSTSCRLKGAEMAETPKQISVGRTRSVSLPI